MLKTNMNKTSKNETGFSIVEAVLVLVVIVLIGVVGYMVYKNHHKTTTVNPISSSATKAVTSTNTTTTNTTTPISLASGSVTLDIPNSWVKTSQSSFSCNGGSISTTAVCVSDGEITVTPSSLHTPNSNFSGVSISVFQHNDSSTAEQWLTKVYGGFNDTTNPESIDESAQPINGYSAFSYESQSVPDSTTPNQHFLQVYYLIVSGNYAVVVTSQVQSTTNITSNSNNNVQNDYTQYLPTIKTIADSVSIKS
jgi:hypothetical protein